eukprot:Pgem_evm1s2231
MTRKGFSLSHRALNVASWESVKVAKAESLMADSELLSLTNHFFAQQKKEMGIASLVVTEFPLLFTKQSYPLNTKLFPSLTVSTYREELSDALSHFQLPADLFFRPKSLVSRHHSEQALCKGQCEGGKLRKVNSEFSVSRRDSSTSISSLNNVSPMPTNKSSKNKTAMERANAKKSMSNQRRKSLANPTGIRT